MKRELKDCIHHYLNTGLKMNVKIDASTGEICLLKNVGEDEFICQDESLTEVYSSEDYEIKPLLLPMSALTEPLEDGTIPIETLARMADRTLKCCYEHNHDSDEKYYSVRYQSDIDETVMCEFLVCYGINFGFQCNATMKRTNSNFSDQVNIAMDNQLALFEYLFAHHFDVFDLDRSEWIDKRMKG